MKDLFNKKTGLIILAILTVFFTLFLSFKNFTGFFVLSYSFPEIINASVEPIKVEPSDYMIITALVKDDYGIESVTADMAGIDTVNLTLVSGNLTYGIWQGSWFVHSVEVGKTYNATIIARNVKGKESYYVVQFHDDPMFAGRMEINVTSNAINRIAINTQYLISRGLMRNDCGDIRFTDSKSFDSALWTRNFSYNINQTTCNTNNTIFYVDVPAGVSKIYAYFGNPAITSITTGWLSSWSYRKPITINNTQNSNSLTDYQVLVTIDTASLISAGKMRSDCGDIRFTDSDGTTLLNYWLESGCNSTSTKIWVKVPSIPASSTKTIYMYYRNPSATSASNGDNTFVFFDDFLGTSLNTTKWPNTGGVGNISVSGGLLTLTYPSYIASGGTYGGGYAFRSRVKCGVYTSGASWGGFTTTVGSTLNAYLTLAWYYDVIATYFRFNSGNGTNYQIINSGVASERANYHIVEARRTGTADKFQIDSDAEKTGLYPTNVARYLTFYASSADIVVDWVLLRKYTSPEPTTSVGEEVVVLQLGPIETWIRISGGSGNLLITGGGGNLEIK